MKQRITQLRHISKPFFSWQLGPLEYWERNEFSFKLTKTDKLKEIFDVTDPAEWATHTQICNSVESDDSSHEIYLPMAHTNVPYLQSISEWWTSGRSTSDSPKVTVVKLPCLCCFFLHLCVFCDMITKPYLKTKDLLKAQQWHHGTSCRELFHDHDMESTNHSMKLEKFWIVCAISFTKFVTP